MAGDQPPRRPSNDASSGANAGWAAVGYLISGIAFWGFVGWLVDRWLHTGGIAIAVGCVLGAAGGVYLIVKKLGA
jgi:F0F1-type ATP synthase assembly protein I